MDIIAFKYGNHLIIQFEEVIDHAVLLLKNKHGQVIKQKELKNKHFFLLDTTENEQGYTVEIQQNDKTIIRKKL